MDDSGKKGKKQVCGFVCAFLTAALFLTHYRVFIFFGVFIPIMVFLYCLFSGGVFTFLREKSGYFVAFLGGAFLLVLPRVIQLAGGKLWEATSTAYADKTSSPLRIDFWGELAGTFLDNFRYVHWFFLALGFAGFLLAIRNRNSAVAALGFWHPCMLVLANPQWFGIGGKGVVTGFAVFIGAYLSFSVLAGYAFSYALSSLRSSRNFALRALVPTFLVVAIFGGIRQAERLEPKGLMLTRPDLRAMAWVRENIPPDAAFWVNGRMAYNYVIAGTDAGVWVPYFTGHRVSAIPLACNSEKVLEPDIRTFLYRLFKENRGEHWFAPKLAAAMAKLGFDHIYVGQRRGMVWPDDGKPLDPALLSDSPFFETVYARDGVRIFRLVSLPSR
jgi:hypothetical protein